VPLKILEGDNMNISPEFDDAVREERKRKRGALPEGIVKWSDAMIKILTPTYKVEPPKTALDKERDKLNQVRDFDLGD
jgi:hypothetical protein